MEPDLSLVFAELNLSPTCTLEEFQRAVRRRISDLHPDRAGRVSSSPEDQATLHRLLATYSAVTRFHRRYGRMPGTPLSGSNGSFRATMVHPALQIPVADEPESESIDGTTVRIALLFIALVLLLASWDWLVVQSA